MEMENDIDIEIENKLYRDFALDQTNPAPVDKNRIWIPDLDELDEIINRNIINTAVDINKMMDQFVIDLVHSTNKLVEVVAKNWGPFLIVNPDYDNDPGPKWKRSRKQKRKQKKNKNKNKNKRSKN